MFSDLVVLICHMNFMLGNLLSSSSKVYIVCASCSLDAISVRQSNCSVMMIIMHSESYGAEAKI